MESETFKLVNGVPTKILSYGKNVEDDLSEVQYLVLVFPGNPGIIDYYKLFMEKLYAGLEVQYPRSDIPVWGISHAGHQVDNMDPSLFPSLEDNPDLYSLNGQYDHTLSFIKTFIPKHIQVIGIGHSIGCKIWLETIKSISRNNSTCAQIFKCFMLFPTLEKMRETPNGKKFSPLFPLQKVIEPILWPLTLFPTAVQKFLLHLYFKLGRSSDPLPNDAVDATLQLFNFQVLKKVVAMARCEFDQVYDLDVTALSTHMDKLFFYFGTTDDWCPLSFVDGMKAALPGMKFKVCDKGFKHAFVLSNSAEMADIITELIDLP